jgi:hypothetical protein
MSRHGERLSLRANCGAGGCWWAAAYRSVPVIDQMGRGERRRATFCTWAPWWHDQVCDRPHTTCTVSAQVRRPHQCLAASGPASPLQPALRLHVTRWGFRCLAARGPSFSVGSGVWGKAGWRSGFSSGGFSSALRHHPFSSSVDIQGLIVAHRLLLSVTVSRDPSKDHRQLNCHHAWRRIRNHHGHRRRVAR